MASTGEDSSASGDSRSSVPSSKPCWLRTSLLREFAAASVSGSASTRLRRNSNQHDGAGAGSRGLQRRRRSDNLDGYYSEDSDEEEAGEVLSTMEGGRSAGTDGSELAGEGVVAGHGEWGWVRAALVVKPGTEIEDSPDGSTSFRSGRGAAASTDSAAHAIATVLDSESRHDGTTVPLTASQLEDVDVVAPANPWEVDGFDDGSLGPGSSRGNDSGGKQGGKRRGSKGHLHGSGSLRSGHGSGHGSGHFGWDDTGPPDNLCDLRHLHEPSVVHALKVRYATDDIYTYASAPSHPTSRRPSNPTSSLASTTSSAPAACSEPPTLLLSVNPLKRSVRNKIYGYHAMELFRKLGEGQDGYRNKVAPPHIYAVADAAYRALGEGLRQGRKAAVAVKATTAGAGAGAASAGKGSSNADAGAAANAGAPFPDQSILLLGDSGSGKSDNAGHCLKYLAYLSAHRREQQETGVDGAPQSAGGAARAAGPGAAAASKAGPGGPSAIEKRILQSDPILQSFGCARTARNDNASRFGRYTRLHFSGTGALIGAHVETYLLERTRLVRQNPGERNFHVFYELLAGLGDDERARYHLISADGIDDDVSALTSPTIWAREHRKKQRRRQTNSSSGSGGGWQDSGLSVGGLSIMTRYYGPEDFIVTSASGCYDRNAHGEGSSDLDAYTELRSAMQALGFSRRDQDSILGVACACLHALNVRFLTASESGRSLFSKEDGPGSLLERNDDPHLEATLELLGLDCDDFESALCSRIVRSGGERHVRVLSVDQAIGGLEDLTRALYGQLFGMLVRSVNGAVDVRRNAGAAGGSGSGSGSGSGGAGSQATTASSQASKTDQSPPGTSSTGTASIGVLDLWGFENLDTNAFEQLCINYADEFLHAHVVNAMERRMQDEYEAEGLRWSHASFPDNRGVLDLLERRASPTPSAPSSASDGASDATGIFPLLDERCRCSTHPSDAAFASDLYRTCQKHPRFSADGSQRMSMLFSVVHHAGGSSVEYDVEGFVDGNRDELRSELTGLLASSTNAFVRFLAKMIAGPGRGGAGSGAAGAAVASVSSASEKATVAGSFASRLHTLRRQIEGTEVRSVRCLRPNDRLAPESFDPSIVRRQLRRAGVVEASRLAKAGFGTGQTYCHGEFVRRYWMLVDGGADLFSSLVKVVGPSAAAGRDKRSAEIVAKAVLGMLRRSGMDYSTDAEPIQIGRTKVFLRPTARDKLERLRDRSLGYHIHTIQAFLRAGMARRTLRAARLIALWGQFRWRYSQNKGKAQRRNSAKTIQRAARRMISMRQMRAESLRALGASGQGPPSTFSSSVRAQKAPSSSASWRPRQTNTAAGAQARERARGGQGKRHSFSDGRDMRKARDSNIGSGSGNNRSPQRQQGQGQEQTHRGQTKGQPSARPQQQRRLSSSCPPNEMAEKIRKLEEERAVMREELAAATTRPTSAVSPLELTERNRRLEEENVALRRQVEALRERTKSGDAGLQHRVRNLEEERDQLKDDLAAAREEILAEAEKHSEELQGKIEVYRELEEARNHAKELARQLALTQKVASKEIKRLRKENSELLKVQGDGGGDSPAGQAAAPASSAQAPAAPSAQRPSVASAQRRSSGGAASSDVDLQRLQADAERQRLQSEALKRRLAEEQRKAREAKEDMNAEMGRHRAQANQLRSSMAGESSKATGEGSLSLQQQSGSRGTSKAGTQPKGSARSSMIRMRLSRGPKS